MRTVLVILIALSSLSDTFAQAQFTAGPRLTNDEDNRMNRMLGGDETSFYAYRVRSKGRGTSFYVEKYDRKSLSLLFSKEISLDEETVKTKIEDVLYSNGNVFIFRRQYDKQADKMTLYYQTVSSTGAVAAKLETVTIVSTDHYEFVDFDIYQNPSKTKFLLKSSHKPGKESDYKTDFMLFDAGMGKLWSKTVNRKLVNKDYSYFSGFFGAAIKLVPEDKGFVGLYLDDIDNIYYCYTEDADMSGDKEKRYRLHLGTLNASDQQPKTLELKFDDDYSVTDVEFLKSNNNELVVGGFVRDVIERKGRDLVKIGLFSYKVNLGSNAVSAKAINFFDDNMLKLLESSPKRSKYFKYKLDYIIPVGDAVYYVGEQYNEWRVTQRNYDATNPVFGMGSRTGGTSYNFEYMDVIVGKLNANGTFEWIKNVPLRNTIEDLGYSHVFKQYIAYASDNSLYILCNDHPKNMERYEKVNYEPSDLKTVTKVKGSNFVCNQVDLSSGKISRAVIFENEDFSFTPITERNPQFTPPSVCEIFVPSGKNELIVYTEDKNGRGQFGRLKFK